MIKFQYWRTFKKFYGKVWCKILKCSNDNEQSKNMCSLPSSSDYFYTNIKMPETPGDGLNQQEGWCQNEMICDLILGIKWSGAI